MIILSNKRYNAIMSRLDALEDAVTAPNKSLRAKRKKTVSGGMFMHEAIHKIMLDGIQRDSKRLTKDFNKANLTGRKLKRICAGVRLAEMTRNGKLVRVSEGVYRCISRVKS